MTRQQPYGTDTEARQVWRHATVTPCLRERRTLAYSRAPHESRISKGFLQQTAQGAERIAQNRTHKRKPPAGNRGLVLMTLNQPTGGERGHPVERMSKFYAESVDCQDVIRVNSLFLLRTR